MGNKSSVAENATLSSNTNKTVIQNPDVKVVDKDSLKLFTNETDRAEKLLLKLKKNTKTIKKSINEYYNEIKNPLDEHFIMIWQLYKDLPEESREKAQKYYQVKLHHLFSGSPYNKRVYTKPLGYPGDFLMMKFLYENKNEGKTLFDKIIHKYSMMVPTAIANRNRKEFYKNQILLLLKRKQKANITSIACGPAFEIKELIQNHISEIKYANFCLLDFENKALTYIKKRHNKIKLLPAIRYINANIISVLNKTKTSKIIDKQDLIYSSGLIDYFNDGLAKKLIESMFERLKNKGRLIIGNVSNNDQHMAYEELLGEWYLHRRDSKDLLNLAKNVLPFADYYTEKEATTGMNIYLILEKK